MNETVLITSKPRNAKEYYIAACAMALLPYVGFLMFLMKVAYDDYSSVYNDESYVVLLFQLLGWEVSLLVLAISAVLLIIARIWYVSYCKISITVTDKSVCGRTVFGKQVNLPLDSVSAIGMKWKSAIAISTASGTIAFGNIANRDDVYRVLSDQLSKRQGKAASTMQTEQKPMRDPVDELRKYKELLDSGVITQEEFDAKKNKLLEL